MTPVFGEFLGPAAGHITAAVSCRDELPYAVRHAAIRELGRLTTTLARYLSDLDLPDEFSPASKRQPGPEIRAALDARNALCRAAASLQTGIKALADQAAADDEHPAVRHLRAAADYLTAGRDLLQTHFTSGSGNTRTAASSWAPLLVSGPVTAALLTELAACARLLAPWTAQLSVMGSIDTGIPAQAALSLHIASRWMQTAGTCIQSAQRQHSPPASARSILDSVPANVPPPRQPPDRPEPVTGLCDGITITAQRLRRAAVAFASHARWSPAATSLSWRRDALASAISGHCSELILRTLAEGAGQLSTGPALQVQLASAADAMAQTWPAWRAVAHQWDIASTGTHTGAGITPVAREFGDLVIRLGRLAYRNPHWTPASAEASLPRLPADLAGAPGDIRNVLAAAHQAADTVSVIAAADREAVREAAADHRLYVPTRLIPEGQDMPYRYSPAPAPRIDELLTAYDTAIAATKDALANLDDLAAAIATPSHILAMARAISATQVTHPSAPAANLAEESGQTQQPCTPLQPGPLGRVLHHLQISDPAALLRAAAIDRAARELALEARKQAQRRAAAMDLPGPHNKTGTPRQPSATAVPAARPVHATPARTGRSLKPRQIAKPGT